MRKEILTQIRKYFYEIFGTEIQIKKAPQKGKKLLPLYLNEMYDFFIVTLLKNKAVFLTQNTAENLTVEQYRKQIEIIERTFNLPAVLVFERLQSYQRKRLIEKRIAFVHIEKQTFIPHFFMDLREIRKQNDSKNEKLIPAAQALLFYHLLIENLAEVNFKTIAKKTEYSAMTVTRVAKNLCENNLCEVIGAKEKKLIFKYEKKYLWEKAKPHLQNPIKIVRFLPDEMEKEFIFISGYSALAYYTNISDDDEMRFAISTKDYENLLKEKNVLFVERYSEAIALEVWKYPPRLTTNNKFVDPLSLYVILKNNSDERTQIELEKLVEGLW